jgi:3'(2'), 5'-bisphosphate nucleotidase
MHAARNPSLSPPDLLPQVLRIAQDAGQAIMAIYDATSGTAGEVSYKADGSPLTQADLAAHRIIAQGLSQLTPGVPVVSEEDSASEMYRQPVGRFWLVDPLDGTKEFVARNGEFTVNIALIEDGHPVLGVVVAPALGQSYWGGVGQGAWREANGKVEPIRVATPQERIGHPLRVLASKSHLNEETRAYLQQLGPHELVQVGSSLKFCRMAEGSADLYPRLGPTCEWDTAAGQAILESVGGTVQDRQGAPLRYGKPASVNPDFVARIH